MKSYGNEIQKTLVNGIENFCFSHFSAVHFIQNYISTGKTGDRKNALAIARVLITFRPRKKKRADYNKTQFEHGMRPTGLEGLCTTQN